jgi:alpha-glucosidase
MSCISWKRGAIAAALVLWAGPAVAASYTVQSPGGNLTVTVKHDHGALFYDVASRGTPIIQAGALGIVTSKGDFSKELAFVRQDKRQIDETYTLPVGKRSTYVNKARELELVFRGKETEVSVIVRAYDDGIAFRYALGGTGAVEISAEPTTFPLASKDVSYWGQAHPNNFGYETPLGPVTADRISMPVLAELKQRKHFVMVAQAASYGTYIIPNYKRSGNTLALSFPMDQKEPVKTTLPFQSPWRVVMVSPANAGKIIESTLLENLNPPTEAALANAAWIRPGRASWDYIAGDGDKLRTWIDFDSQLGWEYHVADAGWERRVPDMAEITKYGKDKKVGIVVWGKVANKTAVNTPERAEAWMAQLEKLGVSGAKIDFFDQRDTTGEKTDDLEDTQARLHVRDFLAETAARHHLVVEFHGCAIPSGERRRWPHLMSAEAVAGLERKNQIPEHDLTIPFVRNVMGPVSYTPVLLARSAGSYAYQLGQAIIYEAGIQIYAERHDKLRTFEGLELMTVLPSAWDETRFLDGSPGSHVVIARRKGKSWFIGGITADPRTTRIPLSFLPRGAPFEAAIYRDGDTKTTLLKDHSTVTAKDTLKVPMLKTGGFAIRLDPAG